MISCAAPAILVVIHLALLIFLTHWTAPTQDEPAHLSAGLAVLRFGKTDLYRVNPPLVRALAAIPLLFVPHREDWSHYVPDAARRCEWDVGADFVRANGINSFRLFTIARWCCLPFSVMGMLVCWKWGCEKISPTGGLFAAALWCFSPNLLGHGALLTSDVAATACGLLAAWRMQHWREQADWKNTALAGLSLGVALLTKTYWILLLGLWPLILFLDLLSPARCSPDQDDPLETHAKSGTPRFARILQLGAMLLIGWNILNLGYGFAGTGTPLKQYDFFSRTLAGIPLDPETDAGRNRFRGHFAGELPMPFPRDYVQGIDLQKQDFERPHRNYLCGRSKIGGWWFYYLIGLGVKVPLGTWLLVLLGSWTIVRRGAVWSVVQKFLPLWAAALTLFVLVSLETGMNRHVRYVFPVLPALFLLAGHSVGFSGFRLPQILLLTSIGASLVVFPHCLCFFNFAVGGPGTGDRFLIESNLDWGQDLGRVRQWLRDHPECRPATVSSVASYPLSAIGIDVPRTPPGKPVAGWHLISRHLLNAPSNSYSEYRKLQPVGRVGWTFNIYTVPDGQIPRPGGDPHGKQSAGKIPGGFRQN